MGGWVVERIKDRRTMYLAGFAPGGEIVFCPSAKGALVLHLKTSAKSLKDDAEKIERACNENPGEWFISQRRWEDLLDNCEEEFHDQDDTVQRNKGRDDNSCLRHETNDRPEQENRLHRAKRNIADACRQDHG